MGQMDDHPEPRQLISDDLRCSDAGSRAVFFAEFGNSETAFSAAMTAALGKWTDFFDNWRAMTSVVALWPRSHSRPLIIIFRRSSYLCQGIQWPREVYSDKYWRY